MVPSARIDDLLERLLRRDLAAERTRIAREIHDTLAQGLAGVSLQLENVADTMGTSSDTARRHLDRARELVQSSLAEAREAIYCLRSGSALPLALSAVAQRLSPETSARIGVQVTGAPRLLPPHVETNLVLIAQEAIRNAIKHADASEIHVVLRFESRRVLLCVRDDGRGFAVDRDAGTAHFGLEGMRERAGGIGGSLAVRTAPGLGTEIEVAVRGACHD